MLPRTEVSYSTFQSPKEVEGFRCEKQGYVDFVCKPEEALKHQKENLTITYLFWFKDRPIGYVALATGSLRKADLPSQIREQKPYRHIPCVLLGQMARDLNYKMQGVGKIMVDFTISTARKIAEMVGCRYVILDAELDKIGLYKSYGFQEVPGEEKDKTRIMYFDLGFREELRT
jgi:hypothetical protein